MVAVSKYITFRMAMKRRRIPEPARTWKTPGRCSAPARERSRPRPVAVRRGARRGSGAAKAGGDRSSANAGGGRKYFNQSRRLYTRSSTRRCRTMRTGMSSPCRRPRRPTTRRRGKTFSFPCPSSRPSRRPYRGRTRSIPGRPSSHGRTSSSRLFVIEFCK